MPVVAIDFDGTIFVDEYPFVGEPLPGAIETINRYHNLGWTIIINTCREGDFAENAILALEEYGTKYSFFNNNDPVRTAQYGYDPRKIGSDIVIDDRCLYFLLTGVDWELIDEMLCDFEDIWTANKTVDDN